MAQCDIHRQSNLLGTIATVKGLPAPPPSGAGCPMAGVGVKLGAIRK
jgi:hypothetical protein